MLHNRPSLLFRSFRHARFTWLTVLCAFLLMGCQSTKPQAQVDDEPLLSFAVIGDAEPKPLAEFPNMTAAVDQINALADRQALDFVAGIGDIPHKGTTLQYDAASEVLTKLDLPFYTIMGNEELGSTPERYLSYLAKWNEGKTDLIKTRYVLEYDSFALVFASPDYGRDFDDSGIVWILENMQALGEKPVLLFVHSAQAGAYPEKADKGIKNTGFAKVLDQKNLAAIISGDLHMDMDRVEHSKEIDGVHYLHIPALERTKVPDETNHTPMFRSITIRQDLRVFVDTYQVGVDQPLARHAYQFKLPNL